MKKIDKVLQWVAIVIALVASITALCLTLAIALGHNSGPAGPKGDEGPTGPQGPPGKTVYVPSPAPAHTLPVVIPAPVRPPSTSAIEVVVAQWAGQTTPLPDGARLDQWNTTLWGIANHYGVAGGFQELARVNHISNPNLVHPGEVIVVP